MLSCWDKERPQTCSSPVHGKCPPPGTGRGESGGSGAPRGAACSETPPWSPWGSTRSSFWGGKAGWGADVPTSTSPTPQCGYGLILPSEPKRVLLAAAGGRRESSWVSSASAGIARASKGTAGSPFPGGQKLLIPTVGSRATYCPQPPCGPAAPCPIGARAPGVFSAPMLAARPGAHHPAPRSFGLWSKRRRKHPLIPRRQLRRCKIGTNGSGEAVAVSSDLSAGSERGSGVAGGAEGRIRAQAPAPGPCTTTALPRGCCQPRRLVNPSPVAFGNLGHQNPSLGP